MRLLIKVLVAVVSVLLLIGAIVFIYNFKNFYSKAEIITVTDITSAHAEAIQKEFGFTLPEGANIVQCRFANSRDRLFTVVITGVSDTDMFLKNNLNFEVGNPYETERYTYGYHEQKDLNMKVTAKKYFGMLDSSKRELYIYSIDDEIIIEIEKGGIISSELIKMFGV